jgi:hypothetical protein
MLDDCNTTVLTLPRVERHLSLCVRRHRPANEENFPNVNDYRNIVVAEAMKVLGFVNRHSRG